MLKYGLNGLKKSLLLHKHNNLTFLLKKVRALFFNKALFIFRKFLFFLEIISRCGCGS